MFTAGRTGAVPATQPESARNALYTSYLMTRSRHHKHSNVAANASHRTLKLRNCLAKVPSQSCLVCSSLQAPGYAIEAIVGIVRPRCGSSQSPEVAPSNITPRDRVSSIDPHLCSS